MKTCFKCDEVKPFDEFYKHKGMPDGFLNKCKECAKADARNNYRAKIDYYKAYDKSRAMLPHRVAMRNAYQKTTVGKEACLKAKKAWTADNPKKKWCAVTVNNAVRDGRLEKSKTCSNCNKTGVRIHGHHDDYDKVFDVRWLCSACHISWHRINGEGKNPK